MTLLAEQIIGVWSGSAFPTQETTLIFCRDGQGLLFFYLGSSAGTPFVDEFTWSVDREERLVIRWRSRHEIGKAWDEADDMDAGEEAEDPREDEPEIVMTSGAEEIASVEWAEGRTRALRAALGMHEAYADTWLVYANAPDRYEAERERLRAMAETFDPFGPNRRVWRVDGDRWSAIRPFFWDRGWLGLNRLRSVLSFLFFGAMGQTLLWAKPLLTQTTHRGWILLPLLFLPLFALFRETYLPGRRWYHACLGAQMLLSALYLLMALAGVVLAVSAGPAGKLVIGCTAMGMVPALYLLWANPQKWRLEIRADPTLSRTFRDWRHWRFHGMNVWLFVGIMAGVIGEMLFLLRLGPPWMTKWPRVLLHCVPALIAVCDEGEGASVAVQKFGALWYMTVLVLVGVTFAHGWRPAGWPGFFAAMLFGIGPCVYAWRKPRQERPNRADASS